jgi:hypothetical protein
MPPKVTEPQDLDQAMDSAMNPSESINNDEVVETPAETQPSNEAVTTTEDSYTRIDPKSLPPELQAMHRSLLSDYTKKTQAIAKQRKEFEEKMKAQIQPETPQTPQVQDKALQIDPNMSIDDYTKYMLSQVEEKIALQKRQAIEEQEQKFLDNAVTEFEGTDERLNPESPAYDKYMRSVVGGELDDALKAYAKENGSVIGFDYQAQTKELIEQYENYTEKRAKELATQRTQEAFNGVKKTAPMGVVGSKAPSKPAGIMSLDDAVDNAFSKQ